MLSLIASLISFIFFNGENNNFSSKNEVNLITTQYNIGNNLLLIHKTSKDFTSKKIKVYSLNNNILTNNINNNNNNNIKDEIEEKQRNNNTGNNTGHIKKRNITLNDLKNDKLPFPRRKTLINTTFQQE